MVDVDHVPGTRDDSMRPNQILAVGGVPLSLIDGANARRIVDAVQRDLLKEPARAKYHEIVTPVSRAFAYLWGP